MYSQIFYDRNKTDLLRVGCIVFLFEDWALEPETSPIVIF